MSQEHPVAARGFASDNNATVHPEVLAGLARANAGHALAYGDDALTRRVEARFAEHFGAAAQAFLVFNGTAANVLSLRAVCRPWEAAICTACAHLNVDECGAPEAVAGVKLIPVPARDGKLTPEPIEPHLGHIGDQHAMQPRVISISQATELGTVYAPQEVAELARFAHAHGLLLHVDGARLSNAAAALGCSLAAITTDVGVDILSFGATKNGAMLGEAVVLLSEAVREAPLGQGFRFLRKQSLQLASKMRFLAAQFEVLFEDELWRRCAEHANGMAARLADRVAGIPGVTITRPVQANAVFATLPREAVEALQERSFFYVWDEDGPEVRWMCSWDTTEADVDAFAGALTQALA